LEIRLEAGVWASPSAVASRVLSARASASKASSVKGACSRCACHLNA